jgi:hypothetical protein
MMDRLRDQTSSPDALTARAARLLSAMPPLDTGRVRPPELPDPGGRRAPAAGVPAALVLAVVLASVAAAAAAVRTWPLGHGKAGHPAEAPQVAAASQPVSPPAARAIVRPASTVEATGDGLAAPVAPEPGPRWAPATLEPSRAAPAGPGPAVSQREVVVEDESTLIVRAVRALRREGDPARAQALAEQALQKFPHGAQAEEAMALIMEAASARGDASGAQQTATAYLARFGSGRFADRARRILASRAK